MSDGPQTHEVNININITGAGTPGWATVDGRLRSGHMSGEGFFYYWGDKTTLLGATVTDFLPEKPKKAEAEDGVSSFTHPGDRVVIPDFYGDGLMSVVYRPEIKSAPLTLNTHEHFSIDMTLEQLADAIVKAGGPRLVITPTDRETIAKIIFESDNPPGELFSEPWEDVDQNERDDYLLNADAVLALFERNK